MHSQQEKINDIRAMLDFIEANDLESGERAAGRFR